MIGELAIVAAYLATRKSEEPEQGESTPSQDPSADSDEMQPDQMSETTPNFDGWIWPVLNINDRQPVISNEFVKAPRKDPHAHLGVDIMFRRLQDGSEQGVPPRGSKGFYAPDGATIVAVGPGRIWDAKETKMGLSIQIDHGIIAGVGVNTFYQHLSSFERNWTKGDSVQTGDVLGVMGGNPSEPPHLVHLHFEIWFPQTGLNVDEWPHDPAPFLSQWSHT